MTLSRGNCCVRRWGWIPYPMTYKPVGGCVAITGLRVYLTNDIAETSIDPRQFS